MQARIARRSSASSFCTLLTKIETVGMRISLLSAQSLVLDQFAERAKSIVLLCVHIPTCVAVQATLAASHQGSLD